MFAFAGRRPGESSSVFKGLGGGDALEGAGRLWATLDRSVMVVEGATPGLSLGDLHARICEAAQIDPAAEAELYLRDASAASGFQVAARGDARAVPADLLAGGCIDVQRKAHVARELSSGRTKAGL